jgi:phage major head subunit gpT-like protein
MGMSLLNADKILQTQIEFSAMFNTALNAQTADDPVWDLLAREIETSTRVTLHTWLGDVMPFQEWKDERPIGKLAAENYQITVKRWANGLEVDEDDIDDDNLGMYTPKIQMLAMKARTHKKNLLVDFLINGFATTKYGPGYDGVAFFSSAHPDAGGGANMSNTMTASLDDSGAFYTAMGMMEKFRDLGGEPADWGGTHLIYGPDNQATVDALLESDTLANGATNPNFRKVTPLKSRKLVGAYANYWFLVDLSKPVKPLIWQVRRKPKFRSVGTMAEGATSYQQFLRGKLWYGADARHNAGYGFWQTAIGSTGAT